MFIDTLTLSGDKAVSADICIAGAGIAGISLARELIGQQFSVCLLESGGLQPDRLTQSLYWGENVGHPYFELDTARACGFGGTSNRWSVPLGESRLGVRLRPLDVIDFEKRRWVPYSGWPFGKSELDPYYIRAQKVCKAGPFDYEPGSWEDSGARRPFPFRNGKVKTAIFQFGHREHFYREYRDEIASAGNITTYLNANVVEIEREPGSERVSALHAATLNGKKIHIAAKIFVLAMGGIEVPRIMLISNRRQKEGLGNHNGLVGRFFMEHPHLWLGYYIPNPEILPKTDLYSIQKVNGVPVMGKLALGEDVLRSEGLLNYCVSLHKRVMPVWKSPGPAAGIRSVKAIGSALKRARISSDLGAHLGNVLKDRRAVTRAVYGKFRNYLGIPVHKWSRKTALFELNHMMEQAPNPMSRVMLSDERDLLGRRRPKLNWQLTSLEMKTIIRAQEIIDKEMRRAGIGKLEVELNYMMEQGPEIPRDLHGGWHHMGTTRMHTDPKRGVVDENCRVHGTANLYVAGPSVFPTCGYANPVLTTVALALRLGDHLKNESVGTILRG